MTTVTATGTVCGMTVVAAIASEGRVVMAADTVTQNHGTLVQGARKIRRMQSAEGVDILLSGSGDGAIVQVIPRIIQTFSSPTVQDDAPAWDEWAEAVASRFSGVLAEQTPPLTQSAGDGQTIQSGSFLIDLALGVLSAVHIHGLVEGMRPENVVDAAVRIACRYDPHCAVGFAGPQIEVLG